MAEIERYDQYVNRNNRPSGHQTWIHAGGKQNGGEIILAYNEEPERVKEKKM